MYVYIYILTSKNSFLWPNSQIIIPLASYTPITHTLFTKEIHSNNFPLPKK